MVRPRYTHKNIMAELSLSETDDYKVFLQSDGP